MCSYTVNCVGKFLSVRSSFLDLPKNSCQLSSSSGSWSWHLTRLHRRHVRCYPKDLYARSTIVVAPPWNVQSFFPFLPLIRFWIGSSLLNVCVCSVVGDLPLLRYGSKVTVRTGEFFNTQNGFIEEALY